MQQTQYILPTFLHQNLSTEMRELNDLPLPEKTLSEGALTGENIHKSENFF